MTVRLRVSPARAHSATPTAPARHKTEHHGIERLIYLGSRAQAIITPYLLRPTKAYLFSPKDAVRQTRERLRRGNNPPKKRRPSPKRIPGNRYTRRSYYSAIKRGCEKAGIEVWGPNRLRHSAATYPRKRFGIEAARVVLGHRSSAVTEVYAELDRAKAADIMVEVG